jgi:hypothetical protein
MTRLSRRQFLAALSVTAAAAPFTPLLDRWLPHLMAQGAQHHLYIARNGTPVTNVQRAVALAGGIQTFIGHDDAVVLKPNGQWPLQGYTHTQSMKALIDVILNRPGGFAGEIIIAEHVHRDSTTALNGSYCWNMSSGSNRVNNWPDMNYFELVNDYHSRGINNVTAIPLYDVGQSTDFVTATGPSDLAAGKHGWVRATYTTTANSRTVRIPHALLRSAYSGNVLDLKNGVWNNGNYTGQPVKVIFLPTLNNHGSYNSEDYAGPTCALKCHLGIVEFAGPGVSLHSVGYDTPISPQAMGESVGHLITQVLQPAFYLTVAEYTGYRGRTTTTAANTKTVGLCADPVTLDYWMCKYVMYPCATSQTFMNPDNDNHLRQALIGCQSKGVGTIDEAEMQVHLSDISLDKQAYLPLIMK